MIDIDETEKHVKLLQSKSFIRMQLDLPEVLELIERVRQAEARIAELDGDLRLRHRQGVSQGRIILELEARIAEAAKLHRKYTYYELEDSCPDTSDEHREEHHHESDEIGEFYCDQMPTGDVCCDTCRDVNGDRVDWPCETAKALPYDFKGRMSAALAAADAVVTVDGLQERIEDTLAYYQCRETNPKADHPSMGYHAFSEDQREWLRAKKSEAAAEIVRMILALLRGGEDGERSAPMQG